jgi:hypothetical protein
MTDMKRHVFALAALASLAGGGDASAQAAGCITSGLPTAYQRVVEGKTVFVRNFAIVLNQAIDDFGSGGIEDGLAVYCVTKTASAPRGNIAICLSKEFCPWR